MTSRLDESSPQTYARVGGALYLFIIVAVLFGEAFVRPTFAAQYLFPWMMLPAFPAELGLALWLAVKGVNIVEWQERLAT